MYTYEQLKSSLQRLYKSERLTNDFKGNITIDRLFKEFTDFLSSKIDGMAFSHHESISGESIKYSDILADLKKYN